MENRCLTVEELKRLVKPKKHLLHQEWLEPIEYIDDTVDSIKYAFSTYKDPIIVKADKKPIRWLSDFTSN